MREQTRILLFALFLAVVAPLLIAIADAYVTYRRTRVRIEGWLR